MLRNTHSLAIPDDYDDLSIFELYEALDVALDFNLPATQNRLHIFEEKMTGFIGKCSERNERERLMKYIIYKVSQLNNEVLISEKKQKKINAKIKAANAALIDSMVRDLIKTVHVIAVFPVEMWFEIFKHLTNEDLYAVRKSCGFFFDRTAEYKKHCNEISMSEMHGLLFSSSKHQNGKTPELTQNKIAKIYNWLTK